MNRAAGEFTAQPLPYWRRAVLKVGSSLLAGFPGQGTAGGLDGRHAKALAAFIADARAHGREVVLVSSGAVAAGRPASRVGPAPSRESPWMVLTPAQVQG